MLAEFLGTEISKVANELDKLMILLPKGTEISPVDIEKNIGISKDFNVFELQNALSEKNTFKANQIINYFGANHNLNPIPKTIASLFFYFNRILKYHLAKDKSKGNMVKILEVSAFFIDLYVNAERN